MCLRACPIPQGMNSFVNLSLLADTGAKNIEWAALSVAQVERYCQFSLDATHQLPIIRMTTQSFELDDEHVPIISRTERTQVDDEEDLYPNEDQEDARAILLQEVGTNRAHLKVLDDDPLDDSPASMVHRVGICVPLLCVETRTKCQVERSGNR